MHSEYIETRNGGYFVAGTRVSLDSVVYAFQRGESPEGIRDSFPVLKLAQIYGAIAFYLDHQAAVDEYLRQAEREFEASRGRPLSEENPQLWERLQRAKAELAQRRSGEPNP